VKGFFDYFGLRSSSDCLIRIYWANETAIDFENQWLIPFANDAIFDSCSKKTYFSEAHPFNIIIFNNDFQNF